MNKVTPSVRFLCIDGDEPGGVVGRCEQQCSECRDIEARERSGKPPVEIVNPPRGWTP